LRNFGDAVKFESIGFGVDFDFNGEEIVFSGIEMEGFEDTLKNIVDRFNGSTGSNDVESGGKWGVREDPRGFQIFHLGTKEVLVGGGVTVGVDEIDDGYSGFQ
jgi:hypothetical protein